MEPIHEFQNVIVSPALPGSNKSDIKIPASAFAAHLCDKRKVGRSIKSPMSIVETDTTSVPQINLKSALYGGVWWHNYGHFLTESIHRLWPIICSSIPADTPIVFYPSPQLKPLVPQKYSIDILRYIGIPVDNIIFIDKPFFCEKFFIPTQAKLLGDIVTKPYSKIFSKISNKERPLSENIYVSRSDNLATGSYFGERLIERILSDNGFLVIKPEDYAISELVSLYRSAKFIVFSEGSPIHVLEITGPIDADVLIVSRRHQNFVDTNFAQPLKNICEVYIFDAESIIPALYWDGKKEAPVNSLGCSLVDINSLISCISDMTSTVIHPLDNTRIRHEIISDMMRWMTSTRVQHVTDESIGKCFKLILEALSTSEYFKRISDVQR